MISSLAFIISPNSTQADNDCLSLLIIDVNSIQFNSRAYHQMQLFWKAVNIQYVYLDLKQNSPFCT